MRTKFVLCGCIILSVIVVTMATPCFAGNLIYGCVKNSGELLIVSGPGQCKANQTPISWPAGGLTAVHGVVLYDGSVESGEGFTPSHVGTGLYTVVFDQHFSSDPHCVVTPFQSPATVICAVYGFGGDPTHLDVDCYAPGNEPNGLFTNFPTDVSFSFICISELL